MSILAGGMTESVHHPLSPECLSEAVLIQASLGRLGGEERARALAHAARCTACRRALEAAVQGTELPASAVSHGAKPPESEPPAWTPPPEFGPFRLGPELGRGAMGVVYRARNQLVGRDVALKFIASAQPGFRVEEY